MWTSYDLPAMFCEWIDNNKHKHKHWLPNLLFHFILCGKYKINNKKIFPYKHKRNVNDTFYSMRAGQRV